MSQIDVIKENIQFEQLLRESNSNKCFKRRIFNSGYSSRCTRNINS